MIEEGFWFFQGKRILLLQGPIGPFFRRLSEDLRRIGATVTKINFNGGDTFFYPFGAINFRGTADEWPEFFEQVLEEHEIDVVILFGDCRPIHRAAHKIALDRNLEIGVFEEGYIRPDYISFERFGVNANSLLSRDPNFYLTYGEDDQLQRPLAVGVVFWHVMTWAMLYNTASRILAPMFPHYCHHRSLTVLEGAYWLRSFWRKFLYAVQERGIQEKLETEYSNRFFLVPMQLYNDAQISVHSEFSILERFIGKVISSFAAHAPKNTILVFKHHPLDRGFSDYSQVIERFKEQYGLESRVLYIHDQPLPALLKHALGVILINSTVGMSALYHGVPLIACGKAIFNMKGLTFQGCLDEFWTKRERPSAKLVLRFRNYLIQHTQINGSFYKRLPVLRSFAGIYWGSIRKRTAPKTQVPVQV